MLDRKKIIIHDLPNHIATTIFDVIGDNYIVIDSNIKTAKCNGCFKCWLKTPGICAFPDKLEKIGQLNISSTKLIIITEMLYGGVSIPVKKVLDRSIPGVTPFFKIKSGQLHHLQRYKAETEIKAIFYKAENLSENEKRQGKDYINAMGNNFYSKHNDILFVNGTNLSEVVI